MLEDLWTEEFTCLCALGHSGSVIAFFPREMSWGFYKPSKNKNETRITVSVFMMLNIETKAHLIRKNSSEFSEPHRHIQRIL